MHAEALDLSDVASVDSFARAWRGPLDILVANAGIMALPTRTLTPYGWEMQLATNYLGHFALATGLHAALRDAGSARIVVVSSGAHLGTPFDFEDPHFARRPYDPWAAYGQSKTADVLFTVGARRWAADGITANALNPGYILTRLQRHVDDETMRAFGVMDDQGNVKPLPYYKIPNRGGHLRPAGGLSSPQRRHRPLLRRQPGGPDRRGRGRPARRRSRPRTRPGGSRPALGVRR
ncbi:SDR family NAD(P)-dependent oxidoreductase [Streptomyces lividans]